MNTDYLKDWDAQAEAAKTTFLELLYKESGRTNGLFTGLYEEWIQTQQVAE